MGVINYQSLGLGIVGYLIPVCFAAFVESDIVKVTFVVELHTFGNV